MPDPAANPPPPARTARVVGKGFVAVALLALFATTLILSLGQAAGAGSSTQHGLAVVTFLLDLTLVTAVLCGFGYAITGYPSGFAMSSWNDYSLSKLQMALWTIVVVSGLLTIVKIRVLGYFGPVDQPLDIFIPGDLLAAMGIAAFTTAATPAILALKSSQTPGKDHVAVARQRLSDLTGEPPSAVTATGSAIGRISPDNASWLDIVTGDEAANAGVLDLSKVQALLITLLLVGGYAGLLVKTFATVAATADLGTLPDLSPTFVGLLAISHAGYLMYKAAPKSGQTTPPPTRDGAPAA
jgi:hypothetical protein